MSGNSTHLKGSIEEVNDNSWIIGKRVLLSRINPLSSHSSWSDGKSSFYVISQASDPPPNSRPLSSSSSDIRMVYDAGGVSAVWSIGTAFFKVKILDQDATREHVTLDYIRQKQLSFAIPDVLYHAEYDGRYYIVLSGLKGHTLNETWPGLAEAMKQYYACRVAEICEELADSFHGDDILCGVDGNHISDRYLAAPAPKYDFSPQALLNNYKELGLQKRLEIRFYHCDVGPGNVIVDTANKSIGIIDWETAGFVPIQWIRTKFCVSSGMDLTTGGGVDWRRRVQKQLEGRGFREIADEWMAWRSKKRLARPSLT